MPGRGYSLPPNTGKVFQGGAIEPIFGQNWITNSMAVLLRPESAWNTLKNPLFGLGILSFDTFGGKLVIFPHFTVGRPQYDKDMIRIIKL